MIGYDRLFPKKKRSTKAKKLKEVEFTPGVYGKNIIAFTTNRPVRWALAFEKYVENFKCRWQYKTNKRTKRYSEAHLLLAGSNTKIVVIIYFNTGVITLQGDTYTDWINNEFPTVQKIFSGQEEPDEGDETDKINEETLLDIETLYQKEEDLANAVNTQDGVIQGIINRCQKMELKFNTGDVETRLLEVEKNFDKKLSVFMETILEDVGKQVENVKKYFEEEIA